MKDTVLLLNKSSVKQIIVKEKTQTDPQGTEKQKPKANLTQESPPV